jgi:Peptidase C13 family
LPTQILASEETQVAQQAVLEQKLAALKPHRPAIADIYFVSYAPDASEDVFIRETSAIQSLMNARFDTLGRALVLVNHASTYQSEIAASVSHLRKALQAISLKMNPEEDVLVLYLTGHGSPTHELVPRADTMQLQALRPEVLNQLLDEAGLRYAVVAVSACYSGGWIAPLARPERLIMTASAKDRSSFGCGNESAFTYWGRAVFDEGVRSGLGFEQAFAASLPRLQEREQAAGHVWSDPQIAVGSKIRAVLDRAQTQWLARTGVIVPVSESTSPRRP